MEITPVENKLFGAVVTGTNIGALSNADFAVIEATLLDRGFLVFPELAPSDADTIAFAKNFGELEFAVEPFLSNQDAKADGTPGNVYDINTQRMRMILGNETWHTDSTYKPYSSKCAMLSAVVVPEQGGGTGLADMRAGYAALDQVTKDRIANLSAYHSNLYSQANDLGDFPEVREDTIYHAEAYLRPLVKVHPQTGFKNLFIGRHAFGIPGLSRKESQELLKSLLDFVVADNDRVYEHNYRPGDLLVWDNRALLHRALPYDYSQPRTVLGTRVAGEASEFAYHPTDPEAAAGRDALATELTLLRRETKGRRYKATTAPDSHAVL